MPNATGVGEPRAQARDCEVADRIGELRKVAPVDEPAPHRGTPRSTSVQRTRRAATHRFFRLSSSPIPSGSDCSSVASARLHDGLGLWGEGVPHARKHTGRPTPIGPPLYVVIPPEHTQARGARGCGRDRSGFRAQSGGVQHLKILASDDRLGQDANARVLHVAAQIRTNIYVYVYLHVNIHKLVQIHVYIY